MIDFEMVPTELVSLVSTQLGENDNSTAFIFLSPIFLSAFCSLWLTKR